MNRSYPSFREIRGTRNPAIEQWAQSRSTHLAVATAIHAIADSRRGANEIWDSPTPAEDDHVTMAVEEYLAHGDFDPEDDGRYRWGTSSVFIDPALGGGNAPGPSF